jgi:drug/metabolite transporter (DMT)-like permease
MTDNAGRSGPSWVGPGVLLVLATAVLSGVSTFLNGYAVQGTSSAAFVTVRNVAVAALLVPIAGFVLWRSRSRPSPKELGTLAIIGLVGGAIPFLLFFRGVQLATEAHGALTASFVYRTLFLFATVFGVVALRERFRPRIAAAAALVLGGNFLLLSLVSPIWTDGSLYVFAATVLWAAEYTISKHVLRTLRGTTVALGRMGFGAVFLSAYLAATGGWTVVAGYGPAQWTWVLISGALLTGFVLTWYTGLARVDLGVATTVLVLAFPISWALSVVTTGATVPAATVLGATAVAVGVLLALGTGALRATWMYLARRTPAPVLG